MKVKVISATEKLWYSNFVGQTFYVFPRNGMLMFSLIFFFRPEDVQVVPNDVAALLPSFEIGAC